MPWKLATWLNFGRYPHQHFSQPALAMPTAGRSEPRSAEVYEELLQPEERQEAQRRRVKSRAAAAAELGDLEAQGLGGGGWRE